MRGLSVGARELSRRSAPASPSTSLLLPAGCRCSAVGPLMWTSRCSSAATSPCWSAYTTIEERRVRLHQRLPRKPSHKGQTARLDRREHKELDFDTVLERGRSRISDLTAIDT